MSTKPIDFSDLGGRPVQQSQGAVDFSDLGGIPVAAASSNGSYADQVHQVVSSGMGQEIEPTLLTNPRAYLLGRAARLQQEAQRQQYMYLGPEGQATTANANGVLGKGLSYVRRFGHGVLSVVPETAALVDKTIVGMSDPKNAAIMAAGAIDPAIPAAYFGAQGVTSMMGLNGQPSSVGTAIQRPTPENVQNALTDASMVVGAGGVAKAPASGAVARGVGNVGRGVFADRMNARVSGEPFTRQQILDAARAKGINLDLSDATGSGLARGVKAYSERSLGGKGRMRANTENNLQKLGEWADEHLNQYATESTPREVLGGQMQESLGQDLAMRKTAAATAFEDLDKRVGANPVDATNTIKAEAQKILDENKGYYDKHPELAPQKALKIVEDLSKGNTYSWSELHQLRSDLLEFVRNNPEIVKSRAEGWIQKLTGDIDSAMTTEASSKLTPADLEQFRHANQLWEGIKQTYDNPQSPMYHAIRSKYPSQVPAMLSKATPELARQVRTVLGDIEGPLQRSYVETLITDKAGNLDLKNLNSRLSRVPNDFLESMLGKNGAQDLRLLGKVSQRVTANINPSGTSEAMVPAGEIGAASTLLFTNPAAAAATIGGELATGYGTARGLTSPRMVDYLTRRPAKNTRPRGGRVNNLANLAGIKAKKRD